MWLHSKVKTNEKHFDSLEKPFLGLYSRALNMISWNDNYIREINKTQTN